MLIQMYFYRDVQWEGHSFIFNMSQRSISLVKEMLCDLFIFTLEQIIVLNKYCTYNEPIQKISHVKIPKKKVLKWDTKQKHKKVRNKMLTFIFQTSIVTEAIRAQITMKLGSWFSFIIIIAFL